MKKIHNKILSRWNTIVILIVAFFLLVPSLSPAQKIIERNQVNIEDTQLMSYQYTLTFPRDQLTMNELNGYTTLSFTDGSNTNDLGKPSLPYEIVTIALPKGMTATGVQVVQTEQQVIQGSYTIFPAQPFRTTNDINKEITFVEPDAAVYASSQPYPADTANSAKLLYQTDLAGQSMAVVQVFPVQYIPLEKKLSLSTSMTITILGKPGYVCGDYLSSKISEEDRTYYETQVQEMVVNPEGVALVYSQPKGGMTTTGVSPGSYSYVIITKNSWTSNFQPLADWKTKKGMKATIVTTEWIYSTYSGADSQEKIRAFVTDAAATWGTTFFLLGGDTDTVPVRLKYYSLAFNGGSPEDIYAPADTYYADYDADWTCEVHVGRASVTTTSAISTFNSKIFTYEQNPPLTSYAKNAAMFGFDLDASTHGQDVKIYIDSTYIPASWTMSNVYDTDSGNHETNVKAAINAGQNLINHADHGDTYVMGVGYTNHNYLLSTGEVDAFLNGNKQNVFYSLACYVNAFDSAACIAEHFVRNVNGGSVAFVGNSRYGIYVAGSLYTYSNKYDEEFFKSVLTEGYYKVGQALSDSKAGSPHSDDYYKCIFDELNLLGDPEFNICTENPSSLVVTHPSSLPAGPSSFAVHVTSGGSPLASATVCLWKGTDIYLTGTTDVNGDKTFTPSPSSGGTMYVTVTKHNYIPYMGQATVPFHNPPNIPSNPNPVDQAVGVSRSAILSWTGGDPDGNPVTYDVYFGTTNPPTTKVSANQSGTTYNPGTMGIYQTYFWKIISYDYDPPYSSSTQGPVWQFRTIDNVLPEWRSQGQSSPSIQPGESVILSAQGRDNIALDYAYLSTNESGQWVNFSGGNWWDINWDYCKPIVIDHTNIDVDLMNFTVLVACTSPDFINHAQPDGDDFVFVDATNTTVYSHEIEYYNSATGELAAWVNIPFLSSMQDTLLYLYYGNPDSGIRQDLRGTWNSSYIMINHLTGATSADLKDSSANHWDITSSGGNPSYNQVGKAGRCVDFDGVDDSLQTNLFRLPTDSSYTAGAWVYVDGSANAKRYIFEGVSTNLAISLLVWTNESFKNYAKTDSGGDTASSYSTTQVDVANPQWYYVVTRVNAVTDDLELFVNGLMERNVPITGLVNPESSGLNIGTSQFYSNARMNGKIDEIRISNVIRDDSWIKTEYNNIASPSTFLNVGNEIASSGGVRYGSPMTLGGMQNLWVWSNFTWQNPEIPAGRQIGWKIYYVDTSKNMIGTDVMSFQITTQPQINPPTQVTDITAWHTDSRDLYKGIGGYPGKYSGQPYTYQSTSTETGNDLYFTFYWGDTTNTVVGPVTGSASATHIYALGTYSITVTVKHGPSGTPSNPSTARSVTMFKAGDTNTDGSVNWRDIDPFVTAMNGPIAYYAAFPAGYYYTGDTNFDHTVNWRDIDPFVALMGT